VNILDLKAILKSIKINESSISMVLGALVIIIVSVLVVNYFKDRGRSTLPFLSTEKEEITTTFQAKNYIVVRGENLWAIAEKQYGSGYNWVDIATENKIKNPDMIKAGQVLVLPSVEVRKPVVTEKADTVKTNVVAQNKVLEPISGGTYSVVRGDNLWTIAVRAYGDGFKWTQIAKENKLVHPNLIHAGNLLVLPR
jgi:nucleoid-associated protein YgaU